MSGNCQKLAVILVGEHYAGKSKTLRLYLKPKLGISKDAHKFFLNGCKGWIISQSLEEKRLSEEEVEKFLKQFVEKQYDIVILPARPGSDKISFLKKIETTFDQFGFQVFRIDIAKGQPDNYYESKAEDIMEILIKNLKPQTEN